MRRIPKEARSSLPSFPKKKFLGSKDSDFIEKRRHLLEHWMNACLQSKSLISCVLDFLEIPSQVAMVLLSSPGGNCKLSRSERCISDFIRRLNQADNTRSKALRKLGSEFFKFSEELLNDRISYLFLSTLMPLCGFEGVGATALFILNRLLNGDTYRHYRQMRRTMLAMDIKVLRNMSLDLHLLKSFQGDSPEVAYGIIQLIKEHYDRQEMGHMLRYVLSDNPEAISLFGNWGQEEYPQTDTPTHSGWVSIPG